MPASYKRSYLAILPSALVALLLWLGLAQVAHATPAPVPCSYAGGGHYDCSFYISGDGISGGAPVLASSGARIGYLNEGTNWIICQQLGGRQTSGSYYNHTWAWTEANDQQWGWVSAVWARGGDNDGLFGGGVPNCNGHYGNAPGATTTAPAPSPSPTPTPTPTPPAPAPGTTLPAPVNMGSYGTYTYRFQLFRSGNAHRVANFHDWNAEQMMTQVNSSFSHYFTFTGCGEHLVVGAKCSLNTTFAPDAPVEVIAVAPTGFALKSRGGHAEGAGRTIVFQFQPYVNVADESFMSLLVQAWGPLSNSSLLGPLNSATVAHTSWEIFEHNIDNRFPDQPPGGSESGPVEV